MSAQDSRERTSYIPIDGISSSSSPSGITTLNHKILQPNIGNHGRASTQMKNLLSYRYDSMELLNKRCISYHDWNDVFESMQSLTAIPS
jgi:hypothetical protein